MEKEYKKAPAILTGKDLDYIKDIFGWSYISYKVSLDAEEFIQDKEISKFINECSNMFYENMNSILSILENGDFNE